MSTTIASRCDVAIIGAGPAGAVAAALLAGKGYDVVVLERQAFPRFSIGESLLPQCMAVLEEAGMMEAVVAGAFQPKNGATFSRGDAEAIFDFSDKFTPGWSSTFEVQRARFDTILADQAARSGVAVHYRCEIVAMEFEGDLLTLSYAQSDGGRGQLRAAYCLDASGFGQVIARAQGLLRPSAWPKRQSVFTHVVDNIEPRSFDRNKILISVHPRHHDIWFWLIPFSNGKSSLGVVGAEKALARFAGENVEVLRGLVSETTLLASLLVEADYDRPCERLTGYASDVNRLHGEKFALLGNAGGFLDPIFSSGVTIALKSASLAAQVLDRQLRGDTVNWERDFAAPLERGVNTFREFVKAWYDGRLQDIIFASSHNSRVRQMICSILAGYAWDESNPYVAQPERRLTVLAELCRSQ